MFPTIRSNTTHNQGGGASTRGVIPGGGVDPREFGIRTDQIEGSSLHPGTIELVDTQEVFQGSQEDYIIRGLSRAAVVGEPENQGGVPEYSVPGQRAEPRTTGEQEYRRRHMEAVERVAGVAERIILMHEYAKENFTREQLDASKDDFTLAA